MLDLAEATASDKFMSLAISSPAEMLLKLDGDTSKFIALW